MFIYSKHRFYISTLEQSRAFILDRYVLLEIINTVCKMLLEQFCELQVKDQFLEHRLYISALEPVMQLIISSYVLVGFINAICKYCYA